VYVLYGRKTMGTVDLAALVQGVGGFRIDGAAAGDQAGYSVAAVRDLTGDGRAEIAVGAPDADNNGRSNSGSVYVVFGAVSAANVDLFRLGPYGFEIDGAASVDAAGKTVADGGDVNGDGRGDVVIGAPNVTAPLQYAGAAYVVFGRGLNVTSSIDLAALGTAGFRIAGASASDYAGTSVGGGKDVNGDGLADVIVGAPRASNNSRQNSGSVYVVYGRASQAPVDLATLVSAVGLRIDGAAAGDQAGLSVAAAGDMTGDGLSETILGAGAPVPNVAYVILGAVSSANVDLFRFGPYGFRIQAAAQGDGTGNAVAGAGDVNGDGRGDAIVGAPYANTGRPLAGAAYIVFGRPYQDSNGAIDLAALGGKGFRMEGAGGGDRAGWSVSGAGDINGDGRPDVTLGADVANGNGRPASGSVYGVYGFGIPEVAYDPVVASVGKALTRAPKLVRRTGDPSFSVSPTLPAGLRLDPLTGVLSGMPQRVQAATSYTVTMTDLAGTTTAKLSVQVKAQPSSPPPPPPPPRDTKPPKLVLVAAAGQHVLAARGITAKVSCDEACALTVTGTVAIVGTRFALGLRKAKAELSAAGSRTLGLVLSTTARKRLAKALVPGKQARVTIKVSAVDRSGNAGTSTRAVGVRR
jgi:hypothetical protein